MTWITFRSLIIRMAWNVMRWERVRTRSQHPNWHVIVNIESINLIIVAVCFSFYNFACNHPIGGQFQVFNVVSIIFVFAKSYREYSNLFDYIAWVKSNQFHMNVVNGTYVHRTPMHVSLSLLQNLRIEIANRDPEIWNVTTTFNSIDDVIECCFSEFQHPF